MTKIFLSLLALSFLALQPMAQAASSHCTPTESYEEARADYNLTIADLSMTLSKAFTVAMEKHSHANEDSLAQYKNKMQANEALYKQTVHDIRAHYDLGWQDALSEAAENFNRTQAEAIAQYDRETQAHLATYHQETEQARSDFSVHAEQARAHYIAVTCSQP